MADTLAQAEAEARLALVVAVEEVEELGSLEVVGVGVPDGVLVLLSVGVAVSLPL